MRSVVSVRRWALGAALAAIVALVGAASASAASGPPVWGAATPYTSVPSGSSESVFTSVACTSVGNCVAVGLSESPSGNVEQTLVAVESSGTWGPSTTLTASQLPSNANSTANNLLTSVSCISAGSCEAVGSYIDNAGATQALAVSITVSGQTSTLGQAVEVTLPAGAESDSGQFAVLNGVSCNASGCVAVGRYNDGADQQQGMTATGTSGGAWTATELTKLPSNADATTPQAILNSVSCPSGGACEAVGTYVDTSADQQPLAVTVTGGVPGQAVEVGLPADYVPSGATSSFIINEGTTLGSVSCSSAGTCTAVGSYSTSVGPPLLLAAVAVPITGGAPGTAVELQLPQSAPSVPPGPPSGGGATSISCADAGDCSVVGYVVSVYPVALTGAEVGGTWSQLTTLPFSSTSGSSSSAGISAGIGIDCVAAQRCAGVGLEETLTAGPVTAIPFTAASAPQLSMTTSSLPAAQVGKAYSATVQASGGTGNNAWSIGPGSLPAGLSLNASTGVVSGTPTASGQSGFIVADADAGPPAQQASAGLSITVSAATPVASVKVLYLKTSGNKATVVMSCSGAPCKGSLKIAGVERRKGKKVTAVVASKSSKHRITLATGRYSIAAGGGKTAVLKLSGKAGRLLKRLHKVAGYLNATPTGATHPAVVKKATFRATTKHKKHHKKK